MASDDKPWRHGMVRGGKKRGNNVEVQPDITDSLCNEALEFQRSIGFQHHSRNLPTHFSGPPVLLQRKRLHATRSPLADGSPKIISRAVSPIDSFFRDQDSQLETVRNRKRSTDELQEEETKELHNPSTSTQIGRYRAWHPENSFVTEVPPVLPLILPTLKEMQAHHELPIRRLRNRPDGFGGAVLFQPPEEAPPGVEAAIGKVIPLPQGCMETCDFPDRGRWNVLLEGEQKRHLKRRLKETSTSNSPRAETSSPGPEVPAKKRKEDEQPDPRVDLVLEYVKTGDDCVRFFMENEARNRVKVFYCNRAKTAKMFQPYDMVVVRRAEIEDEHFSFSFDGVVHVEPQIGHRKNASFTPLEEWMREKYVFSLLRRISFFGNYYLQKSFNIWKRHIGQRHFSRVRDALVQKLFVAKPAFLTAISQIYTHVEKLSELAMLNLTANRLYNYEEFANLQTEQRLTVVTPAMETIADKIQEILATICNEAKKQAKIYRESVRDEAELDDTIGVNLHQTRGSKVQSMVSIKQEKIERAKTYRRVVAEEKMLGNFIRMADYMFVEGLAHRAIAAAMDLLSVLDFCRSGSDKSPKGVFLTTVSFGESAITFTPDEADILEAVNNAMDGVVQVVQSAPRILHMRVFLPFLEAKYLGTNPHSIIKMTPFFTQLREAISHVVKSDYNEARKYAQIFEQHRALHIFGETWNYEVYAAEKHSVRQYREELARQREWRIDLEKMRTANVVGILHVDSRSLRNTLVPITVRTLELIKGLLVANAKKDALVALAAFQERTKQLDVRPTDLNDFVEYVKMYERMMEGKKAALLDASVVDDMYELLQAYEVKVPTQDQVKLDDLHDVVMTYEDSLEAAYAHMQENKATMMDDLDKKVTALSEELLNILGTLHSGKYLQPESDPVEIVTDLEAINKRLVEIRETAEVYKGYQSLFQMAVDDMGNLTLTEKEFSLRWNVWRALNDWIIMTTNWRVCPVSELNALEVTAKTDEYSKDAYKRGKANKEDTVVFRLKDTIEEFKKIAPIIEEVGNPALKPRHWKVIFDLLKREYNPEVPFTTNDLLSYNVMEHMEEVRTISGQASKEYSFEKTLEKMLKDWDGVKFNVVPYKDSGTFVVGGIDDIQTILDDQVVKILSMCASPYVKHFEKEATSWKKIVLNLQALVDNWVECQATWQYLSPIFSSRDIMRQMPTEGELFQTVDQTWRDVMKKTNANPLALIAAQDPERLAKLIEANRLLEVINKGLAQYLEVKRVAFPRFFFLSNDEMLEILSETKDPLRVQPHLKKCFEGIDSLKFESNLDVTAMVSAEGEVVQIVDKFNPQTAQGAVEKWLLQAKLFLCLIYVDASPSFSSLLFLSLVLFLVWGIENKFLSFPCYHMLHYNENN
ncbi:hypothetical protein R1sor_016017 [Riccia sorocarpa]|uniref:Dynein heavy chain linker domain-containing protein n=1 Tax=Riccia sorocarpa TaxID=122646 RepID=A0ABD3HE83_9MARC